MPDSSQPETSGPMIGPLIVPSPDQLDLTGAVLAIGNFDGVHLGHRALLQRMQQLALELSAPAVIVSFFPTSRLVFSDAGYLSSAQEKVQLFTPFQPAAVVLIPFSREYAQTDKSQFVQQLQRLQPRAIIVGEDFRFGHERAGTLNDLSRVTEKLEVFGLQELDDAVVSSSSIRQVLDSGDVRQAARLLDAPYLVSGPVERGQQRGRTIGFPTANLRTDERKVLPLGVFSVLVDVNGRRYGGMANVGPRPTFPDGAPALEVHLFDFSADIYDTMLTVHFIDRIRSQVRFESLEQLQEQLAADRDTAQRQLTGMIPE